MSQVLIFSFNHLVTLYSQGKPQKLFLLQTIKLLLP